MMKRYLEFIKRQDVSDNIGIKSMDPDNYTDIKDEIKSMIEKTIEAGGIILLIHFIQNLRMLK
jgi:hypothetical protein